MRSCGEKRGVVVNVFTKIIRALELKNINNKVRIIKNITGFFDFNYMPSLKGPFIKNMPY